MVCGAAAAHGAEAAASAKPSNRSLAGIDFIEFMTGGASADAPLPLVLVLHPQGGDPMDFAGFVR